MANFNLIGTLRPMKENGFVTKTFDSGWMTQRLRFMVVADTNTHFVEINAGKWSDDSKNVIYAYTEPVNGEKSQPIKVEWNERNNAETIKKIAGWKIMTVDLEAPGARQALRDSGDKEALNESYEKRHHFLAGTDFCSFVNDMLNNPEFKDVKFKVRGNVNYNYSDSTGKYYETWEVNKIYMADEDDEPTSEMTMDFFFDENSFDDSMFEDYGKVNINGYTDFYDNATKKKWFAPVTIVARDKIAGWKKKFTKFEDDEVRMIGVTCQKINGAERVAITLADLSEEVQESVADGLTSEEQAIRDAGGHMMGNVVREIRLEGLKSGYSMGSKTTAYSASDLVKTPIKEEVAEDIFAEDESDDDEL